MDCGGGGQRHKDQVKQLHDQMLFLALFLSLPTPSKTSMAVVYRRFAIQGGSSHSIYIRYAYQESGHITGRGEKG